jgi:hypothetical protein
MIGFLKFCSGRQLTSSLSSQLRHGSSIKVLLLENVVNRGSKGETVKVKLFIYLSVILFLSGEARTF